MATYRNDAHAAMVAEADWRAKFVAAYCVCIHTRVQPIAKKQWDKGAEAWAMDPVILANAMAREVQLEEPTNAESDGTIGVLAG